MDANEDSWPGFRTQRIIRPLAQFVGTGFCEDRSGSVDLSSDRGELILFAFLLSIFERRLIELGTEA
jgi:hypothetical protein